MWNKSAAQDKKQFGDLPEGTYKAKVISCKFQPAKDGIKTNCAWDLQVIEGEQANNHIWVYRPFSKMDASEENQKALDRVLNDFVQLGVPATTDKIEKTMMDLVGKVIEIKLKSDGKDGQYKNFQRIITEPVAAAVQAAVSNTFPEEEAPF